jgi:hypothetical protein
MPSIGEYTVKVMRGFPSPASEGIKPSEYLGVDGTAFILTGRRAAPAQLQTISGAESASAAHNLVTSYKKLEGTIVSITDGFGVSHSGCMILKADPQISAIGVNAGYGTMVTHEVKTNWTVQLTGMGVSE